MEVTIKDIARRLDISYATVSRALNDKHGVRRETRERVLEMARRLNYRPNAMARSLVKRQTSSIGLVIPDITNPFFPEVARGIEESAQERGYSVFLCNTSWDEARELRYLALLSEKRVAGIIISSVISRAGALERVVGRGLPVVYVSQAPAGGSRSCVAIDNVRGGFLATRHLIEGGHRPVGFIGAPEDSLTLEQRLQGFRQACAAHGLKPEEQIVRFGDFKRESGYNIVHRLIREGGCPAGIFGENDLLAIGALQGAREAGLRVPEDVAVAGFDDIPLASFPEIQLTTICQPKHEMGRIAVQILLRELESGRGRGEKVVLEPRLVVRRSA
jgi:LacI family transcriptional regulator